jgi:carbamoyl-phosphate synthase large subunit
VDFFRQAVGRTGRVYVADMDPHAPAFQESDRGFVVPPIGHPEYCDHLLAICRDARVGMLIPLSDFELPLIARERHRFQGVGTLAIVSAPPVVDMCFDKWATFRFLEAAGLHCPETYLHLGGARDALEEGAISFPLVVKPRWGTASLATER